MFNPFTWLYRKLCNKNTTGVQFESVRVFMRDLGYTQYQAGRFYAESDSGFRGCSVINYRTAVRLHNEEAWVNNNGWSAPKFNTKMRVRYEQMRNALSNRILFKCKQQLVEKYGEPTIKTQSHVVRFADRGYRRAAGMI